MRAALCLCTALILVAVVTIPSNGDQVLCTMDYKVCPFWWVGDPESQGDCCLTDETLTLQGCLGGGTKVGRTAGTGVFCGRRAIIEQEQCGRIFHDCGDWIITGDCIQLPCDPPDV
jgi:hypothetical protein